MPTQDDLNEGENRELCWMAAPVLHDVPANAELRFQVKADTVGKLKLVSGSGELFGVELALGKEYSLPRGKSASIATFYGAKVT